MSKEEEGGQENKHAARNVLGRAVTDQAMAENNNPQVTTALTIAKIR